MSEGTSEPIRFRSQAEIDKMLEKLERNKEYWQECVEHVARKIAAIKSVVELPEREVIEIASRSSGYQEIAAEWLLFRCDDSRMTGGDPD
jgi:CRISPR/Cas system CMR-associated protein Cmr5 small subunit